MSLPSSNPVSFTPATGQFTVASITQGGNPAGNSIDLDMGFTVSGSVSLPDWLPGSGTATGEVCVYVEELGGPTNQQIGCTTVTFGPTTPADPSGLITVNWQINVTAASSGLQDPQAGASQLYHVAAVFNYGPQTTDIAAFVDLGLYMIN